MTNSTTSSLVSAGVGQQAGRAALLGVVMVACAFSEGVGLILLVPMLAALGDTRNADPIGWFGALGAQLNLEALLGLFVGLVILRALLNLARSRMALRLEMGIVDGLRRRAWRALLHCDWRVLSEIRRSDSASVLLSSLDLVGWGIQQLMVAAAAAITLAALGLAALAISPGVALVSLVGGALILLAYRGPRQRAARLGEDLSKSYAEVHGKLGEGLGALRAIKSLGRESEAEAGAMAGFAGLAKHRMRYQTGMALGQLALQGCGAIALAALVWLAVVRWGLGIAAILPLVALFARALPLLGVFQEGLQHWAHARPALTDALSLIDRAEAAREPDPPPGPAPHLQSAITLRGVGVRFAAGSAPSLSEVDLTIPARSIVAVTGPSGAGKSTLADLLGGLISPDTGTIEIDGRPLDLQGRRLWRRQVAYVEQDPTLLAASVRENLLWAAPDADDARLAEVLAAAAAQFALDLPKGLDTELGDGGRRLSGGERQRLMLARALLREPELLILDEATSALDTTNEAAIAEALKRLRNRLTIVVICHRGGLLEIADQVVTFDQGRISEIRQGSTALSISREFTDYSATES